jgi:hypothetical protein
MHEADRPEPRLLWRGRWDVVAKMVLDDPQDYLQDGTDGPGLAFQVQRSCFGTEEQSVALAKYHPDARLFVWRRQRNDSAASPVQRHGNSVGVPCGFCVRWIAAKAGATSCGLCWAVTVKVLVRPECVVSVCLGRGSRTLGFGERQVGCISPAVPGGVITFRA